MISSLPIRLVVLLALFCCIAAFDTFCEDIVEKYAKPIVATTGAGYGGGQGSPAAQVPYGALRLGPDTTNNTADIGYRHCSGYNWVDANIRAFSHTRLVGAGVPDLGNFGVMPTSRRSIQEDLQMKLIDEPWTSHYVKKSEDAKPGRYSVYMDDINVQADLLVFDKFAGVHKYTWNPNNAYNSNSMETSTIEPGLIFDVCHAGSKSLEKDKACRQASFVVHEGRRSFSASVDFHGSLSGSGITMHLYAQILNPTWSSTTGNDAGIIEDMMICTGDRDCTFHQQGLTTPLQANSTSGSLVTHIQMKPQNLKMNTRNTQESLNGNEYSSFSLELLVGLSYLSQDQAKINLENSLRAKTVKRENENENVKTSTSIYDQLLRGTKEEWCDAMKTVSNLDTFDTSLNADLNNSPEDCSFTSCTSKDDFMTIFYSALYRSLLSPTQYSELNSDSTYMGADLVPHSSTAQRSDLKPVESSSSSSSSPFMYSMKHFSDFSLWDTFRTYHPWILLTRPDVAVGVLRSFVEFSNESGRFPKWVLGNRESNCMIGLHGTSVVLEGVLAGYGSTYLDVKLLQSTAWRQENDPSVTDRRDIVGYNTNGYVSMESADNAASLTLSYAFDDHTLAMLSQYVSDYTAANISMSTSTNYKNIWSTELSIMCPRHANGTMACPPSSSGVTTWQYYTEGNPEQWRWFVPHDLGGLMSLFPSVTEFENVLENFFESHVSLYSKTQEAIPNPYYWAGNEVDIMTPMYFNLINCTKGQFWSRRTLDMHYNAHAHGLPGNDDYGTMSAHIMFTSLGLYPRAGSSDFFVSSPRVTKAQVHLTWPVTRDTPKIEVIAYNNSNENVYVSRLLVNGQEFRGTILDRGVLTGQFSLSDNEDLKSLKIAMNDPRRDPAFNPMKGCKLEFFMSSVPKSNLCSKY